MMKSVWTRAVRNAVLFVCFFACATCARTLRGQAAGLFGSSVTPSTTYTSLFNAQVNASNNMVLTDQTTSTRFPFDSLLLTGSSYVNTQITSLTLTNFNGAGIDDNGDLTYCYYNSNTTRINTRIPNGSGGYAPTYNIYQPATTAARCTSATNGTIYHAPGDGTLNVAVPSGATFTVTAVTGAPSGVVGVSLGYNGNLLLAATGGTYVGTVSSGAWTGTLVTTRQFYRYAAYQDLTGKVYLEDSVTQAGYQYAPSGNTYAESSWTKPFNVTAVAYSSNLGGTLMAATATNIMLQFPSALVFPSISVGSTDPMEELVYKITAAGSLGSVTIAAPGAATDFVDAGTGTCTTNGASHTYAVGDLCTIDVKFTPTRGGTRSGTVTVKDVAGTTIGTATLTGTGVGQTVNNLVFTTSPATTPAGTSFSVAVTAYADLSHTVASTAANGTTVKIQSSDAAAVLPTNVTFVNGVASFSVTLNTPGSQKLSATDEAGTAAVDSPYITVTPGVNHLGLTGLPGSATAGSPVSGTVTAYSDSGTTVATGYSGPVKITSSDTNATLPSNLTLSNGTANFNITLKTTPSATISAADTGGSPSVTSGSITVNPGAASVVNAAMGGGQSAIVTNAFTNPLVVQTTDAYGNPVGGQVVNLVIPTNGAGLQGGTYQCTTNASATPAGSCSIAITANATAGSYTVSAQSGTLTAASFSLTNNAKTSQTITFANPGAQNFGTTPTLTASSTSSLTIAFSSTSTGICTITSGGALTFVSAGTCSISADQAGNSTYAAATTVSRSFTVNAVVPGAPTIGVASAAGSQQATVTFTAPTTNGGSELTGYTVTSSPGNITASGTGSPITVSGLSNGTSYTFTVKATNSAGPSLASAASNAVTPSGAQTITFATPGTKTFGTTPTLSASASSGLAVGFSSSTSGVCSITGSTLSFSSTGICSINADQAGDATYSAATRVTQSFAVQAASQTITFNVNSPIAFNATGTVSLNATGGASGNAVTFSVISGPGTVSGSTLTVTGAGTIVVAADQAGNNNYNTATQVQKSIVVNAASQTISFTQPTSPITYTPGTTVTLNATATSGLTPMFTIISGPATVSGTTLTIAGAGTVIVAADQAGNSDYNAATQVQKSITVNAAAQTITFTQPSSPIMYGSSITVALSATGGASGNAVTFTVASGPGTISGTTLTVTGAGTILINADQAANSNYAAAPPAQKSIVVSKASATLTGPATQPVFVVYSQAGAIPVSIAGQYSGAGVTAPSGAISYVISSSANTSVASGSLTISSGVVSVPVPNTLTPGNYTVTLDYAGDTNYVAAAQSTASLQVGQIQPTITWATPSALTYGATLAGVLNAQAYNGTSAVAGSYVYLNGATPVTASTVLPAGAYTLTANFTPTDTTTFKAATSAVALSVGKAVPAASLTTSLSTLLVTNPTVLTATISSTVSTPTGTVTFLDGATQLGAATLTNGAATLTTSSLAVGAHSITALYAGDSNFITQTTVAKTIQVNDFDLSIATTGTSGSGSVSSGTNQTVLPGGTAAFNFTLTPSTGSFPSDVSLAVSGLPTGATYTLTPSTIAAGSLATPVSLTVKLPSQTATLERGTPLPGAGRLAPFALAVLLLPFSGAMRRRARNMRRLAATVLLLLGGAIGMSALTGCGSSTGFFASSPKTYNVVITATSGSLSHSTTVSLTVQ